MGPSRDGRQRLGLQPFEESRTVYGVRAKEAVIWD